MMKMNLKLFPVIYTTAEVLKIGNLKFIFNIQLHVLYHLVVFCENECKVSVPKERCFALER